MSDRDLSESVAWSISNQSDENRLSSATLALSLSYATAGLDEGTDESEEDEINYSINQSINQSTNAELRSESDLIEHRLFPLFPSHQPINQSIPHYSTQSINQSISQSNNQSTNQSNVQYYLPFGELLGHSRDRADRLSSVQIGDSKHLMIGDSPMKYSIGVNDWLNEMNEYAALIDRSTVNQSLIDWLIYHGHGEIAACMKRDSGIQTCQSDDLIDIRMEMRKSILSGDIITAIQQLEQIVNPSINQSISQSINQSINQSDMRFQPLFTVLHLQQLIELIRINDTHAAFEYATKHILNQSINQPELTEEFERIMSLLAYTDPIDQSPDADLLSFERRLECATCVNTAVLMKINLHTEIPKLNQSINQMFDNQSKLAERHILPQINVQLIEYQADPPVVESDHQPITTPATQPLVSRTLNTQLDLQANARRSSLPMTSREYILNRGYNGED